VSRLTFRLSGNPGFQDAFSASGLLSASFFLPLVISFREFSDAIHEPEAASPLGWFAEKSGFWHTCSL
jgi:hypothetical protein